MMRMSQHWGTLDGAGETQPDVVFMTQELVQVLSLKVNFFMALPVQQGIIVDLISQSMYLLGAV